MSLGERSERKCGGGVKIRKLVTASLQTYLEEREKWEGGERERDKRGWNCFTETIARAAFKTRKSKFRFRV